jgi:hypothetical protein
MATFLVLQQELADRLAAYDQTVSADATKLKRWLNLAQQYICGKRPDWAFMLAQETIQTVADYTTGTASVSAAGATVTFSGTIADSKANQYIQFASSNDWYKITAHTAGTNSATISPVALAANTAAAYTIRKLHYATTTPLLQILDMKQLVSPGKLEGISPMEGDFFLPLYYGAGNPSNYIMSVPSSTGIQQFSLFPSPSATINIMVRGIKVLTDMSADGDVSLVPQPWHDALVNIGAYFGFQGLDDTRAKEELAIGEGRIADMKMNYAHDWGRHRVMNSVGPNSNEMGWNLPPYFDQEL